MERVRQLLAHPRVVMTKLRRKGTTSAFYVGKQCFRGLHAWLDRNFAGASDRACSACRRRRRFEQRRRASGLRWRDVRLTKRSRRAGTLVAQTSTTTPSSTCTSGNKIEHGQHVDAQLHEYVKTNDPASLRDRCARAIVQRLERNDWRLVASQVPVHSVKNKFASAIDLVCVSADGRRLAVVETKSSLGHLPACCYGASTRRQRDRQQVTMLADAVADECAVAVDARLVARAVAGKCTLYAS